MVLTEDSLKLFLSRNKDISEIPVEPGTILTPSARQFLNEKGLKIVEKNSIEAIKERETSPSPTFKYRGENGEFYTEKPESMTQISGNILVKKNHKRIIFRGKIDSLQSKWLVLVKDFENIKNSDLQRDLKNIEGFIKNILVSEVLETPFNETTILNETFDNIRAFSHNPKKYFGCDHLFNISSEYSYLVIRLNEMRSFVREVELVSIDCKREDLIKAFNRLSSAIYIMMLKGVSGKYGNR